MVIYFSKVSIMSTGLFEVYEDRKRYDTIIELIMQILKDDLEYEKVETYIGSDGEHTVQTKYRMFIRQKEDRTVNGIIYKHANIWYKQLDPKTKNTISKSVETVEDIQFFYDVKSEFIGFHTRNRFGYQEFNEAFAYMLHNGMKQINQDIKFLVSLYNEGLNIAEIEESLKQIPGIKKLVFNFSIPNPADDTLLDELEKGLDGTLEQMKESNAHNMSVIFNSDGKIGLNIESKEIKDNFKRVDDMHQCQLVRL